ncbi:MAG TPA: hypothetical protein DIU15_03135, partial [Deltaproteobacteria bacterium]|nr:hypothetical protein [Deltaproteobacteria bacterium]
MEEERRREAERLAAIEAEQRGVDLAISEVVVGTVQEGKPYLVTRYGRSIPVKVNFNVRSLSSAKKVRVVAQGHDALAQPIQDFVARSSSVSLREGENSIPTYLKVPSSLSRAKGSFRILTHLEVDDSVVPGEVEEFIHLGSPVVLHSAELDPSVVVPAEEVILLADLQLGGWSVSDTVKLQVDIQYYVAGTSHTDSFPIAQGIGFHEMEMDLRVPEGLPPGDGSYTVTVTASSGHKSSKKGSLRVFSSELVAQGESLITPGARRRIADDEEDEVRAAVQKARSEGTLVERNRTLVLRTETDSADADIFDDEFDMDDFGSDALPPSSTRGASSSQLEMDDDFDELPPAPAVEPESKPSESRPAESSQSKSRQTLRRPEEREDSRRSRPRTALERKRAAERRKKRAVEARLAEEKRSQEEDAREAEAELQQEQADREAAEAAARKRAADREKRKQEKERRKKLAAEARLAEE